MLAEIKNVKKFLEQLKYAGSAVYKKCVVPVLHHVLLEFSENSRICGTDLEEYTCAEISQVVYDKPWSATVEYDKLLRCIDPDAEAISFEMNVITSKNLKGEDVQTQEIVFRDGSLEITLESFPAEQFPAIPKEENEHKVSPSINMKEIWDFLAHAVSSEESRFTLNGVLLDPCGYVLATDGHQLLGTTFHKAMDFDKPLIISRSGMSKAKDFLGVCSISAFTLRVSDSCSIVYAKYYDHAGRELYSRCPEGSFPDWKRVITSEVRHHIGQSKETCDTLHYKFEVDREISEKAFIRVTRIVGGPSKMPPFRIAVSREHIGNKVKAYFESGPGKEASIDAGFHMVSSNVPNMRELVEEIPEYDLSFSIHTGYLKKALSVLDGELCQSLFVSKTANETSIQLGPLSILGSQGKFGIIMPMRNDPIHPTVPKYVIRMAEEGIIQ